MKSRILLILLSFLMVVAINVSAQDKTVKQQKSVTPEEMAQKETEKMTKDLSLTSDQQTKIQAINLKYAKQRHDAMANKKAAGKMTDDERKQLKGEAQKNMDAQEAELKTVLTPEQYQKYLKNKEQFKDKAEKKAEKMEHKK